MVAAYADGEVDGLRGHTIRKHLRLCRDCAAKHQQLTDLRARIRAEAPYFKAPAALRERVMRSRTSRCLGASKPCGRRRAPVSGLPSGGDG